MQYSDVTLCFIHQNLATRVIQRRVCSLFNLTCLTTATTAASMSFKGRFKQAIAFRPGPVTVLVLLIYTAIYISVEVTDDLPSVPDAGARHGLDLDQAYADLHQVCRQNI